MPDYWPDSLRREVESALADPAMRSAVTREQVEPGARELGIPVVPYPEVRRASDTVPVILFLSQPGFNHDSTIAVVRVSVECGLLCGAGTIWLLSRRPGYRWLAWFQWVRWVS
jgi:hypothetical protein